jgi:hypothetical protein
MAGLINLRLFFEFYLIPVQGAISLAMEQAQAAISSNQLQNPRNGYLVILSAAKNLFFFSKL